MLFSVGAGIRSSLRGPESFLYVQKSVSVNVILRGCGHRTVACRESVELTGDP